MYSIFGLVFFNFIILFISFVFSTIRKFEFFKIFLLTMIISFYFGLRPINIGADTITYYNRFVNLSYSFEIGFNFFTKLVFTIFGPNYKIYFFLISFITISNLLIAFKLLIKNPIYIFSAWIIVSLPYSILMQVNIIRQGLALSYFFLGISIIQEKKLVLGFFIFFLSSTIHSSIPIYIISFLIALFIDIKKSNFPLLLFLFLLVSLTQLPSTLIGSIDIYFINSRLFDTPNYDNDTFFFVKILFYASILIFFESFYTIDGLNSNKKISLFYFIILASGLLIFQNQLYSIRYLLALDFLLPSYILLQVSKSKKIDLLVLTFLVVYLVFVLSVFSTSFEINFEF